MNEPILPQIVPITNKMKDITGHRFERLVAIGYVGRNTHDQAMWLCLCDCGNYVTVAGYNLNTGNSNSCGCYKSERVSVSAAIRNKTHGMKGAPEYKVWCSMLNRCNHANDHAFANYGARGVKVCERWRKFENFFADMGHRPTPNHSLDRIDNDGNYELSNCRWATLEQQQNNRRVNRRFTYNGETHTIAEWSRIVDINYYTLWSRLCDRNWTTEDALTLPLQP